MTDDNGTSEGIFPPPPQPPPPPRPAQGYGPIVLAGLGGLITALLAVLVVVLVTRDSGEPAAVTTTVAPTTTATPTTTAAPTTTAPTTTTTTTLPAFIDLVEGDILAAGDDGVRVVRDGEVLAKPIDAPTVRAFVGPGGSVVFHGPIAADYPARWPPTILLGEPVIRIIHADGRTEVLYEGGDWHHLFGLAEIPAVAEGPSVVLVRSDVVDDFPFRTDSIVVVPMNGSPPHQIEEVAGFESIVTGLAWMDGFFAVAFAGEGIEAFDALDLDGQRVPWPENPEPADTRDFDVHVANLTRVGFTSGIVYTRTTGFAFEEVVELVSYDTESGIEFAAIPVFEPGYDATAISASLDAIVVSGLQDTGSGDWPFAQAPLVVFSSATPEGLELDVVGSGSIVGP